MRPFLPLFALAAIGCGDKTLFLADANNFSWTGDLDGPHTQVASRTDLEICWDQVLDDMQCHEVVPADDLGVITMARFQNITEEEVEEQLGNDTLQMDSLSGYFGYWPTGGETCAMLSDFTLEGSFVDIEQEFYEGGGVYMLLAGRGTEAGQGTVTLEFLEPVGMDGEPPASHSMGGGCEVLDFSADLGSLETVSLPADGESWMVDWGNLETNGLGLPLELSRIDRLMVGYYAGLSAADLESSFLDMELIADGLWYLDIPGGFTADLAQATTADGSTFTGFDGEGTWVLALFYSHATNPAPLFLTIVEPD
jgi:hypothetical protein